jgi:predicted acyltransferase
VPETLLARPAVGTPRAPARRDRALDLVRGLAVVGMLLVNERGLTAAHPTQLRHADWVGFRVADVVFPLFLFCMGVAMSISRPRALPEAARRHAWLFGIGVALSAIDQHRLVLAGVLQHIAVTGLIAWFVLRRPVRQQIATVVALLAGCTAVGIVGGFDQGATPNVTVNRFLFGRDTAEGVLVMVCSVANVVGGAWVGRWARSVDRGRFLRRLAGAAGATGAAGLALSRWVPIIKREWTPSYALVGFAGCCVVLLAAAALVDRVDLRVGAPSLERLGTHPLVVYVACSAAAAVAPDALRVGAVAGIADIVGPTAASLAWAALWVAVAVVLAGLMSRRGWALRL